MSKKVQLKRRRAAKAANRARLSLQNPPTGYTMSVKELAELTESSRNNAYEAIANGIYPSVKQGAKIKVLVLPTLAILRGERPPGESAPRRKAKAERAQAST